MPTHRNLALSEACLHICIHLSGRTFSHRRQAGHNACETVQALRTGIGARYSVDAPIDQVDVVGWCVLQLGGRGRKVGMETFKDAEANDKITFITGGKVIIVDIKLAMDCNSMTHPSCLALLPRPHTPR